MSIWHRVIRPITQHFRRGRRRFLERQFPGIREMRICDLDGSCHFWDKLNLDVPCQNITIYDISSDETQGAGPDDSGGKLEFIVALPGRRYKEFTDMLEPLQSTQFDKAKQEELGEASWNQLRLIVAHNPATAQQAGSKRDALIAALQDKAEQLASKLNAQDAGKRGRGRKLSDGGARARFYHEVADAQLARIIRIDMDSELFTYDINVQALARAKLMDGKLLLVTNVKDLIPVEIFKRYKSLADIERGFRVLKSEIEIAPIHHRLPDRIRAHATIGFIALILYRVMRTRLHARGAQQSPERALQQLRRIQHHRVTLNASQPSTGLSSIDQNQAGILAALTIK